MWKGKTDITAVKADHIFFMKFIDYFHEHTSPVRPFGPRNKMCN